MTEQIHICQLVPEMKMGGVETGTLDLGEALVKLGFCSSVISNGGELSVKLEKAGVQHWNLPVHRKGPFSILRNASALRRMIINENIDILHARSRAPAWVGYLATIGTGAHFITTAHGYYSKHFGSRIMGWGERVIVVSGAIREHMIRDFGVHSSRIRLINRGVNLEKFQPASNNSDVKRPFHIGIIGRLTPLKGHEDFLRAFALLHNKVPDIRGFIVGDAGKGKIHYKESIMALCEDLGLRDHVTFMGACSDVSKVLSNLDLLVLATRTPEAFGRVIIEAQAMGVPVIGTRVGGVVEIIEDGTNGLLVDGQDVRAMATAMERLFNDKELRQRFSKEGIHSVRDRFSLDKMVEKTVEVYREIIKKPRVIVTKFGALGDLVLISPALRSIRKAMKGAHVSLVISSKYEPLMRGCSYIDEIMFYDKKEADKGVLGLYRLARELCQRRYDIGIDFQNNRRSHWLQYLAGAKKRVGYRRGMRGWLLTDSIEVDATLGPIKSQEQLLKLCGIKLDGDRLETWPGQEAYDRVFRLLDREGKQIKDRLVAIHPGSGEHWPSKRWPIEKYLELSKKIQTDTDRRVVFVGGRESKEWIKDAFDNSDIEIIDLIGKTSLPELAAVLTCCEVLVTGDSGPLHLGLAAGIPVVGLFGPTDPVRHLPSDSVLVIRSEVDCSPCYKGICPQKEHKCMNDIDIQTVFNSLREILHD
ncbi:MAG: GT4 family glycosyltransferase PelF [Candidatus Theseobacter exili]|nr:GT4 family glycosyltransferase PelF [Candidatus Theseobacter exili]